MDLQETPHRECLMVVDKTGERGRPRNGRQITGRDRFNTGHMKCRVDTKGATQTVT